MTNYKPDWDNIPKEFKYCYYHVNTGDSVLAMTEHSLIDKYPYSKIIRPPELVDGAWYAVTNICKERFIGEFSDNEIHCDGEWVNVGELTIHKRIPDDMWEDN